MPLHFKKAFLNKLYIVCLLAGSFSIFFGCQSTSQEQVSKEVSPEIKQVIDKATSMADTGKYDKAIWFLDSAVAEKELSVPDKFRVLGFKAGTYHRQKDTTKEIVFVDSMFRLVQSSDTDKYKREYASANYSRGDVLLMTGDYNKASAFYYKAREIAKNTFDSCTIGEYSYRIGMVLYQQLRYNEAADEFKEAYKETSCCEEGFVSYYRRQEVLNNIALSYIEVGKNDSALHYANSALRFIASQGGKYPAKKEFNEMANGVVYGTIGRVYKQTGDYRNAKDYLKRSIAINTKKGYENVDAQFMQLQLAEAYFLENKVDSVGILLANSKQSIDSTNNKVAEIEWNRLMWKYTDKKQEVGNAYKYLNTYLHLQDSAEKVSNKLNRGNFKKQIELLENQDEINLLQKKNGVKNLLLMLFTLSMVLAVIIVFLFIYILKTTRKNVKTLEGLNQRIKAQKVELEEALQQLEERNNEKDRILRVVAHDLRTPAASASMLAELIQSETNEGARKDMLKLIKTSSDTSLELISEILDATGVAATKEISKEEVSVNNLLKSSVALLRFKAAEKQQQILLYLLKDDKTLFVNKERLERVLNNLITNAIKFSVKESEIQVKATDKGDVIELMVQDQGIGIPDRLKDKVFNLFTEAKRIGTSGEKPYGIGLSICKQIVEEHKGKIWFESEDGIGSTFYITLPKPIADEA